VRLQAPLCETQEATIDTTDEKIERILDMEGVIQRVPPHETQPSCHCTQIECQMGEPDPKRARLERESQAACVVEWSDEEKDPYDIDEVKPMQRSQSETQDPSLYFTEQINDDRESDHS
jgi:hypothetical protein